MPEYDSADTASGSWAAMANDSAKKRMNSVHFTMEYFGASPAPTALPARKSNISGKNRKYAYATPAAASPTQTSATSATLRRETETSGMISRSTSGSRAW